MVHDDRARPVSGEIMSAAVFDGGTARLRDIRDACDAQFETLPRAEMAMPARSKNAAVIADQSAGKSAGMKLLTQNLTAARQGSHRGGFLFWSASLSCIMLAFWISGGHALITSGDAVQAATAKQPLRIASVESRVEALEGRKILFVDGHAENHATMALPLPAIEIAITGNDGRVIRYHLGDRGSQLAPGSRHEFSSRLQAPDAGVKTVSVAFAEEDR